MVLSGKFSILGNYIDAAKDLGEAKDLLQRHTSYTPQHERFLPTQTPEAAVAFASDVKHGRGTLGHEARMRNVHNLLSQVGLDSSSFQRRIGGSLAGGVVIRGLSGGERKKVALACSLALKPKVLFMDEITSGLDSENALKTIQLIKQICTSNGVAAVIIIHQPSPELFELFDRMILLASGKCVFSGPTSDIVDLYESVFQKTMPEPHRLPDELLKDAAHYCTREESDNALSHHKVGEDSGSLLPTKPVSGGVDTSSVLAVWKFYTVFKRNMMCHYVYNLTNLMARVVLYSTLSGVIGLVFWQVVPSPDVFSGSIITIAEARDVIGAIHLTLLISYLFPFAMISTFSYDKSFFHSDSALGLYSPWIYCVTQTLLEMWALTLVSILQTLIVVPMVGLWNPVIPKFESFLLSLAVITVTNYVGNSIVLLASITFAAQDLAFLVGAGAVLVSTCFSGSLVAFPSLPEAIAWFQWVTPVKYSIQALIIHQFKGTPNYDIIVDAGEFNRPDTITSNVGVLLAMFAATTFMTIFILARQREIR